MVQLKILLFFKIPPFSCIGMVLQKILADKYEGIIFVPNSPDQVWYTELHDLLVKPAFIIPPSGDQ